jgi:hypothetical protein
MTTNSNHGGATTDKDGGQMAARQTTNFPDEDKNGGAAIKNESTNAQN